MKSGVKSEALLWVQLGSFILIWVGILFVTKTEFKINIDAIKKLPDVITIYVVLAGIFTRWIWRWRIFRGWLVAVPDLQGTWEGQLDSKWRDPTSNLIIPPIHVFLVIRQTFTTISCAQFTAESESFSSLGQFTIDEENEALYLRYNYTNRPKSTIRDRSTIHDGAALLRVISEPAQRLNGEYWTSRCTAGEMSLRLVSRELRESYPAPKKA